MWYKEYRFRRLRHSYFTGVYSPPNNSRRSVMTKHLLAAFLAVFIGLGFATQASAGGLPEGFSPADLVPAHEGCAKNRHSEYICTAAMEPRTFGDLAKKAPDWKWFITHNRLSADITPETPAPLLTLYAIMYRPTAPNSIASR